MLPTTLPRAAKTVGFSCPTRQRTGGQRGARPTPALWGSSGRQRGWGATYVLALGATHPHHPQTSLPSPSKVMTLDHCVITYLLEAVPTLEWRMGGGARVPCAWGFVRQRRNVHELRGTEGLEDRPGFLRGETLIRSRWPAKVPRWPLRRGPG